MSEAPRRIRSPNYPALSLSAAIAKIGPVFDRERQHSMSKDVALKGLGYSGANGAALGALSAVVKYGLLDKSGDSYRVSARAVAILHPSSTQEKLKALRDAAYAPPLFLELSEQFPGGNVSDDNLSSYLIRKDFSKGALVDVISAYRETMQMVSSREQNAPVQTPAIDAPANPGAPIRQTPMSPVQHTVTAAGSQPWLISFDGAVLGVNAQLDNVAAVDKLIRVLEANKLMLPEEKPVAQENTKDGQQATE